ncbi:hypothetical protein BDF20DRAFT_964692 [Mycotypha africana]|uniref:uncharacterized protein n=1 Tax=Mycotypha africana TaxID=64632 RepID=UPI002300213A|nr:uncharacterized protein BDF20DRAFT_964692 [Mycotypha africana]KAI8968535.1 hypothetical protein BDF20DRAFT_964692 [Mycotypha africana]
MYVDYTKSPFIDIQLPSAIVVPSYFLIVLYSAILYADYYLFRYEHRLHHFVSPKQLRLVIIIYHILIPMIFVSKYPHYNLLFAAAPWFLAVYTASLPPEKLSFQNWIQEMINITIDKTKDKTTIQQQQQQEEESKLTRETRIRLKGLQKVALGFFKLAFMHVIVNPWLPTYGSDALEYAWLHPLSVIYTLLYGIKAYCFLGAIDIFMGAEQAIFSWDMVDLFDSPILSASPRDFWSRRWNKVIRNLLHEHVFTGKSRCEDNKIADWEASASVTTLEPAIIEDTKKSKTKTVASTTKRVTRSTSKITSNLGMGSDLTNQGVQESLVKLQQKPHKQQTRKLRHPQTLAEHSTYRSIEGVNAFNERWKCLWGSRRMRGLLSFIISGVFHELIIMSTCRHITLENLLFFTLQGVAVMLELETRTMIQPHEELDLRRRVPRIMLQLLFMAITGRLFTAPFLKYNFLAPNFSHVKYAF